MLYTSTPRQSNRMRADRKHRSVFCDHPPGIRKAIDIPVLSKTERLPNILRVFPHAGLDLSLISGPGKLLY